VLFDVARRKERQGGTFWGNIEKGKGRQGWENNLKALEEEGSFGREQKQGEEERDYP